MNDFILNTNITNDTNVMNMLVHEYRCIREITYGEKSSCHSCSFVPLRLATRTFSSAQPITINYPRIFHKLT